jgi:hypothetical protein
MPPSVIPKSESKWERKQKLWTSSQTSIQIGLSEWQLKKKIWDEPKLGLKRELSFKRFIQAYKKTTCTILNLMSSSRWKFPKRYCQSKKRKSKSRKCFRKKMLYHKKAPLRIRADFCLWTNQTILNSRQTSQRKVENLYLETIFIIFNPSSYWGLFIRRHISRLVKLSRWSLNKVLLELAKKSCRVSSDK